MKILMATGGSSHSELALQLGRHLIQTGRAGKRSTILSVAHQKYDQCYAESVLARVCKIFEASNTKVETKIRIGHPPEEIVCEAEEGGFKLVIVGEKQHHNLKTRFLLGSTAVRVVEHAPCPVIIAKGEVGPLRRILLCDGGDIKPPLVNRFTDQLIDLIKGDEDVTILHVMSQISAGPTVTGQDLRANAEELIADKTPEGELFAHDCDVLQHLGVPCCPKVRHGFVVDEILRETREHNYSLVVIGAFQSHGWRRILLDDLAHQIITKVYRPVLVMR